MRVLLADDQVWLRSALRLLLEHELNIEVVGEVGNARALPESTACLRPDLILLDWELTDAKTTATRQQLLATLRAIQPRVYILALTSSQESEDYPLVVGADAVVSKVEPPACLLAALQQAALVYAERPTPKHG